MSSTPKQPPGSDATVETYRLPRWDSRGNPVPEEQPQKASTSEDIDVEQVTLPTAEEVRQIHEDAYNDGFESGYEQGLRQGQAEGQKQGHQEGYKAGEELGREAGEKAGFEAARAAEDERIETELKPLATLLEQLEQALPEQESALKDGLVVLATRIARNVIDAELGLKPEHIASLAHAAVQALPNADERLTIELNPADRALVERVAESHWTLNANDDITRGGCIVRTRFSYIDYTLEHRYRQQVANLLTHLGLSERLAELEQPWPLPEAESQKPGRPEESESRHSTSPDPDQATETPEARRSEAGEARDPTLSDPDQATEAPEARRSEAGEARDPTPPDLDQATEASEPRRSEAGEDRDPTSTDPESSTETPEPSKPEESEARDPTSPDTPQTGGTNNS